MRHWIRSHLTYANVMVTLLAFVVLGGMSYAATGGNFILGKSNTASSKSTLSAPIADKALTVTNDSSKPGASALGLNVAKGHPPFKVNSGAKVANLNADKLDGIDLSQLPAVHLGTAPQGSGGTVINWNDLGARFRASDSANGAVQIVNTRSSGNITALWGGNSIGLAPGQSTTANLSGLTTFIVYNAEGTKSWLVACAPTVDFGAFSIRCQGVASRFTG